MLLAAALLTGCVAGDTEDPGGLPHRDLAATPESLPPEAPVASTPPPASGRPTASVTATGVPSGGSTRGPSGAPSGIPSAGPSATGTRPASGASPTAGAAFRTVGSSSDGAADTEGSGPAYADLAGVTVEDDGTNARVTVTFRADVPARLPAGETMGVGVDVFRSATQNESDYQLFTDGSSEGWYAYLQQGTRFVRYPGRFGIGGRRIVFTVPWSALGSPRSGRFSAFADWTRDAEPVNEFSEDHAPNLGTVSFSR